MLINILKIRVIQLLRTVASLGAGRVIFVLVLAAFISFLTFNAAKLYPLELLATGVFILTGIHIQRKDILFQTIAFDTPVLTKFTEYCFFTLPISFCLLWHVQWIPFMFWIISILIICTIPANFFKPRTGSQLLTKLIPAGHFEWQSGFRKAKFLIISLYLAGAGFVYFDAGIPIIILLLSFIALGFYEHGESLNILISSEQDAKNLLIHKTLSGIQFFTIALFPLIFLHIIFHLEFWYIPIIEVIIFNITLIYSILLKYAFYTPNEKSAASQIFVSLAFMSIFIPVLLPLILILIVYFYHKAVHNLNIYLQTEDNDNH